MKNIINKNPLISVIVPVYKTAQYLHECIDSIIAQTYTNLEIILVDDGSPDICPSICDNYAHKDQRIIVIHKKNEGVSVARNTGLDNAKGEWIAFVDSDDVISIYYIEELVKNLTSPNCVPCVDYIRFVQTAPNDFRNELQTIETKSFKMWTKLRSGGFPFGILYNRDIINKHHLRFDVSLRYVEDVLWNSIYFCYVDKALFIPQKMYYYRKNPTSATSKCSDKKWVVASWFHSRNAALNWFTTNGISNKQQISRLKEHYRICTNNIIAECFVANFNYSNYCQIKQSAYPIESPGKGVTLLGFEYILERYFPRLHFSIYTLLIYIKKRLIHK